MFEMLILPIYETFGPVATPLYVVVLPNSPCLTKTKASSKQRKQHAKQQTVLPDEDSANPCLSDTDVAALAGAECVEIQNQMEPDSEVTPTSDNVPAVTTEQIEDNSHTAPALSVEPAPFVPTVHSGDVVYFVKDDPELTIPVFYSQLVQMKGSDASWVNDTEPPPEVSHCRWQCSYVSPLAHNFTYFSWLIGEDEPA
ncbi:unnamed protein product [Echinostoma caproni]|uniref:SKICH domain-containing protein n=1 Tax=Echinostoma caproni TaxID=27848 RepID=A0A183A462_9TREM|nr:unnamed protein product [Echinostoma caproni]